RYYLASLRNKPVSMSNSKACLTRKRPYTTGLSVIRRRTLYGWKNTSGSIRNCSGRTEWGDVIALITRSLPLRSFSYRKITNLCCVLSIFVSDQHIHRQNGRSYLSANNVRMKHHTETDLIHAGNEFNDTRAVVPPIFQTSTYYAPDDPEVYTKEATTANASYFYHRHGNPVNNQAAAVIAGLEGTEAAMLAATGMAAITTAVLTTVKSGDHVIVQESHYSAANILFRDLLPDLGIQVSRADQAENSSFNA